MAVKLLEDWLLNEQAKTQRNYTALNHMVVREPQIIFIGDSIIEYYPIHDLLLSEKVLCNRGVAGYQSYQIVDHLSCHVFGNNLEKVFILVGTNDIGKGVEAKDTVDHLNTIAHLIARLHPMVEIYLISILPVNEGEEYKGTVKFRTNQAIQHLNRDYKALALFHQNVHYMDVYDAFLDETGQLDPRLTTDGLHLSMEGYQVLSQQLAEEVR